MILTSDIVENEVAKRIIPILHKKRGPRVEWRMNGEGNEGDQFKLLAGVDNNFSYLNTVGYNPESFKDYDLVSITTFTEPKIRMYVELSKKP